MVSTLVLCSVPDTARAIHELRRVLKPNGRLLFLEHVLSKDLQVQRLQRRIEPFWKWFARGCRLTVPTGELLTSAGFELHEMRDEPLPRAPSFAARSVRGVAIRPS